MTTSITAQNQSAESNGGRLGAFPICLVPRQDSQRMGTGATSGNAVGTRRMVDAIEATRGTRSPSPGRFAADQRPDRSVAAVNEAIGGAAPGLGFAIPGDIVRDPAGQIVESGRVVHSGRAALGITAATVTNDRGEPVGASTGTRGCRCAAMWRASRRP